MDRAVEAVALVGSQGAISFSIVSMFLNADLIIKAVIAMLVVASFWSWAIIFEKFLRLRRLHKLAGDFEDMFWSGGARQWRSNRPLPLD